MSGFRSVRDHIVLAGGWSVSQYDLRDIERRGILIGVNDSAIYTKCFVAFTMDRLWLENRQKLLRVLNPREVWYRKGTEKNFVPPSNWKAFQHREQEEGISDKAGLLYGANSGACALNLAIQRSRRVFLLGFDMQRGPNDEKHWYPDYPWSYETKAHWYRNWAEDFKLVARMAKAAEVEVYNVSHRTALTAFPIIDFEAFKAMTND